MVKIINTINDLIELTKECIRIREDSNVRRLKGRAMSYEKSDAPELTGDTPATEAPAVIEQKETPRKRYAAPSAPRVLRCMQPAVKS